MISSIDYIKIEGTPFKPSDDDKIFEGLLLDEQTKDALFTVIKSVGSLNYSYQIDGIQNNESTDSSASKYIALIKQRIAQTRYKILVKGVLDKYRKLYDNDYSIYQSRAGRGTKLTVTNNVLSENLPCIFAYGTSFPQLWIVYRGIPHRMKEFQISTSQMLYMIPEYLFETSEKVFFKEAKDSFDRIQIIGDASTVEFFKGANNNEYIASEDNFSDGLNNLNLIRD